MDIVVRGRNREVPERFRAHVAEKLAKLERYEHRPLRVDVEVLQERNPRMSDQAERVEITAHSRGPVIRAEAAADDPYAALDLAYGKLEARLRRMADRRRVHHGTRRPVSVAEATAALVTEDGAMTGAGVRTRARADSAGPLKQIDELGGAAGEALSGANTVAGTDGGRAADIGPSGGDTTYGDEGYVDDGPMVVREKSHEAVPMTLGQALYEMELVGHDFYLFVDEGTQQPSVVYRRRGYDYGVIRLSLTTGG